MKLLRFAFLIAFGATSVACATPDVPAADDHDTRRAAFSGDDDDDSSPPGSPPVEDGDPPGTGPSTTCGGSAPTCTKWGYDELGQLYLISQWTGFCACDYDYSCSWTCGSLL
jgi:hypothetical protein